MDGGFQFFDIIFFALVAAFVLLRLRSVLGKRTGHEQRPSDPFGRSKAADAARKPGEKEEPADSPEAEDNVVRLPGRNGQEIPVDTPLGAALTQIRVADPLFHPADFMEKAKMAFEYIVGAFAEGDAEKLKPLLAPDVYEDFAAAIRQREEQGYRLETTVVRIKDARLIDAEMVDRTATITVKYMTEQINVTRDTEGEIIEGDPDQINDVTDIWTFERNTRAEDPNWILTATETPQ